MIGFKCSQCGKNLRVSDDAAGKQGKCPQCGATLKVPQQELMTLEAAAPNPTPATASGGECARDRYGCARTTPPALEAESDKHLPIRWLNFYVDIIPVGIVLSVVLVVYALAHGLYSDDPTSVPFILIFTALKVCLGVFLFVGLHRRRLWGWRLNWFVLVLVVLLGPLGRAEDSTTYFLFLIAVALLWLLPNAIYFKKRRYLFTTHEDQSS